MQDVTDESADSTALINFLDQRPDLARNANIVVFAFNAPYYLDATDISKLDIYFGVYSKIQSFIDTSVQALFQDVPVTGRSPVNINGIGYDLLPQHNPIPDNASPCISFARRRTADAFERGAHTTGRCRFAGTAHRCNPRQNGNRFQTAPLSVSFRRICLKISSMFPANGPQ